MNANYVNSDSIQYTRVLLSSEIRYDQYLLGFEFFMVQNGTISIAVNFK